MLPQSSTVPLPAGKVCGVYAIENTVTGRVYIGSSADIAKRRANHWSTLRRGVHRNRHLQNAFNLRGAAAFQFRVLVVTTVDNLLIAEEAQIQAHVPLVYNTILVPQEGVRGQTRSLATRQKISVARRGHGYPHTTETRVKLRQAQLGKAKSAAHRAKLSAAKRGKPGPSHSAETLAKLRVTHLGKRHSEASRLKIRQARARQVIGPRSAETREKIRRANQGRPNPRRGQPISAAHRAHIQQAKQGITPWVAVVAAAQQRAAHPEWACAGARNGNARLSSADVQAIRAAYDKKAGTTYAVLAARFGVTAATIGYIVRRKTWIDV